MKKIFRMLLCAAAVIGLSTSCTDVPSPYSIADAGSFTGKTLPYKSANLNAGWETHSITEEEPWSKGSNYIQATGYQAWDGASSKSNKEVESYLISPAFNTKCESGKIKISFDHTIKYANNVANWQKYHKIFITKEYNEKEWNPDVWEEIQWTPVASTFSDWTLYSSGEIQIPEAYVNQEEVHIAFYFYAPANASTTWELQNFLMDEGEASDSTTPDVPGDAIDITCAEAVQLCAALDNGASSTETYSITGYITDVFATISNGQQSFWMADTQDGGKMVQAYWANLPQGVSSFVKGQKVKIVGQLLKYVKDGNVTTEIKNAQVIILEDSTDGSTSDAIDITCAKAAELCSALADGATSAETYSITGYITDVFATISKGQQSFWMADTKDGGKTVQAYWANLPQGVSAFKVGMKVKITGQLLKYVKDGNITTEIKNANVVILEEGTGSDIPTDAIDISCAKAAELCSGLADGGISEETYSITGYITDVFATVSKGQQSFWMADAKGNDKVVQAYWANLPAGVSAFTKNSKVKITGKLLKYVKDGNVTPEIKNADVQILEVGTDDNPGSDNTGDNSSFGDGISVEDNIMTWTYPGQSGRYKESIVMADLGYTNAQEVTRLATNMFTLEFGKGTAAKNTPKYYETGNNVRVYPGNTVNVRSNDSNMKISRVVLTCDVVTVDGTKTNCVGQTSATLECANGMLTYTNAGSGTGTASQLRIKDITIYYGHEIPENSTKGQYFVKRK